jgi:glycosyltransferase involved in cell wall biosynthesis
MVNVTGIIVCFQTPELLKTCFESTRRFYPDMKIIIIDGSPVKSECFLYSQSLADDNTIIHGVGHNIGHGLGLAMAMALCQTEFVLFIDSDVEIENGDVIPEMVAFYDWGREKHAMVYGVGQIVVVDELGHNKPTGIDYLHPHFSLIHRETALKYNLPIHHGAPMIKTMMAVARAKCRVLNFPVHRFIHHRECGTRRLNPAGFHYSNWQK